MRAAVFGQGGELDVRIEFIDDVESVWGVGLEPAQRDGEGATEILSGQERQVAGRIVLQVHHVHVHRSGMVDLQPDRGPVVAQVAEHGPADDVQSIQWLDLHLAEVDGMSFALQCDPPSIKRLIAHDRLGIGVRRIELRLLVLHHLLAVDEVSDGPIAIDLELGGDPLVTVHGLRRRVDAMSRVEGAVHDDVGPRGAEVAGRPLTGAVTAEELALDGHRKLLVQSHRARVLAVEHGATVPPGPARTALDLLALESIFKPQSVA